MGTRKHTKKEKTSNEPIGEAPAPEADRGLKRETRVELYAARRYLGLGTQQEFGLRMPVQVYFKDPAVAAAIEGAGIDTKFTTPWEPGLRDGPTSARFAVVDYDATSNTLTPPASQTGQLTPNLELNSKIQTSVGNWKTLLLGGVGAKKNPFFWRQDIE